MGQGGEGFGRQGRLSDKLDIVEVVQNWALWRDAGDWERFRTVWHDDGWMSATWFQGPAAEFIKVSKAGFEKGVSILHFLGGSSVDLKGSRAVAQTKMTISQRGPVHGVVCDVLCTGRFFDFLEKRAGRWGVVRRQPIYEKDRLDPLDPAASLRLDQAKLAQYEAARSAYDAEAEAYWDAVAAKRRVRNAKRREHKPIELNDYVLTQPPVYSGPPRPLDPRAPTQPPPERPDIPVVADFLQNASEQFGFVPERPASELDFKRAYAKAALASGLIDAPVFCDTAGGYLRVSNLHRTSFKPLLQKAGLPSVALYALRHTCATLLLLANESAKVVSERLGHSSVTLTLDTYSHVLPTMQRRAANLMGQILKAARAST